VFVPRPAIAVALPRHEFEALRPALADAGYDAAAISGPADLAKVLSARRNVAAAVIDVENDFDAAAQMYAMLHDGGRDVPALLLIPPRSFGHVLLGSVQARDEYFVRPYSADSVRWRLEAMLVRVDTVNDVYDIADVTGAANPRAVETAPEFGQADESRAPASAESVPASTPDASGEAEVEAGSTPATRRGRIVIVFNPKGGVGKTTISINIGTFLQLHKKQRVLLVDCDTTTGHIAPSLGLERPRTLATAWQENDREATSETLAEIATTHGSGVGVLVLASSPLHTEVLEPKRVAAAVAEARDSYDWVILDMHPDYGPLNRSLFRLADRVLLPVTPDVPCIRAAVQFREVATALGIKDRVALVINRAKSGVSSADVERVVNLQTLARIRSAGMVFVRAADEGQSAVERFPNSRVVGDIEGLTERLMAGEAVDDTPHRRLTGSVRSLIGRLAQVP
jgi:MinD-like ATPase involved in chromosome partitioning or flagellar assembly